MRWVSPRARCGTTCMKVATIALVGVIATNRGEHLRVTVATPDTASSGSRPERIVAVDRDRGLVVLDASTGLVTATLDDVHKPVAGVSASPNGHDVYYVTGVGGYDPTCLKARIMHHSLGEAPGVADLVAAGIFPAVDPNGTRLAYLACDGPTGYTDTLVIRDLRSGAERRIPVNPKNSSWWATPPRWSPDGRSLATRVIQGPGGGSPLRILDLEHDVSLAGARVVMFSDAGDVFGYLGATGDLLGAMGGAPDHPSRVVAMDPSTAAAVPLRTLFRIQEFPTTAISDASGHDVLVIANRALSVWSTGDAAPMRVPGRIDFADWLPNSLASP